MGESTLEKFNFLVEILEEVLQDINPRGFFKNFVKNNIITEDEKKEVEEEEKKEEKKGKLERKKSITDLLKQQLSRKLETHKETLKLFNKLFDITCNKPITCKGGIWYYCISKIPQDTLIKSCDLIEVGFGKHENFCKQIRRIKKTEERKSIIPFRTKGKQVNEFKLTEQETQSMKAVFTFIMVPYEYYYHKLDETNKNKPKLFKRKSFQYIGNYKEPSLGIIDLTKGDYILITNVINDNACVGILYNEELLIKYGFPEEFNEKIDNTPIGKGPLPKKNSDEQKISDEEFKGFFKIPKKDNGHYELYLNEKPIDQKILFDTKAYSS